MPSISHDFCLQPVPFSTKHINKTRVLQGQFKEENFNSAMVVLQNVGEASKGDQQMKGRRGGAKGETNCFKIVKMIMERSFAPVIIFSFSKKECETYALQMARLDFNTGTVPASQTCFIVT